MNEKRRRVPEPKAGEYEPEFVFRYKPINEAIVGFEVLRVEMFGTASGVREEGLIAYAHGSMKWDGCMDVTIGKSVMLHNCGPELNEFDRLRAVMVQVYADTSELFAQSDPE